MGRPKKYNPDDVVDKALELFCRKGFYSTSTAAIIEQVGINKFSLYKEFGSNKQLFDRALVRYYEVSIEKNFAFLETTSAGIEDIRKCFLAFLEDTSADPGCMLCNTATEFSNQDPASNPLLERYFKRIPNALLNALDNAVTAGHLIKSIDIQSTAYLLSSIIFGLMLQLRAKAVPDQLCLSAEAALAYLDTLCI